MERRRLPALAGLGLALVAAGILQTGCGSRSALRGDRSATISGLRVESDGSTPSLATRAVPHTFSLLNTGRTSVTIVDARIPIATTVAFADTGGWTLPRTIEPRETVGIVVTAKVREQRHRSWVELVLDDGETVRLELNVELEDGDPRAISPVAAADHGAGNDDDDAACGRIG